MLESSGKDKLRRHDDSIISKGGVKHSAGGDEGVGTYVQEALHEHIHYTRKGQNDVPSGLVNAIKFIVNIYDVPPAKTVWLSWPL